MKEEKIVIEKSDKCDLFSINDIYDTRSAICDLFQNESDLTIAVIAYNRLDVTIKCIENILKYTTDYNYKLILAYNDNKNGSGILEYFRHVNYENKCIIHITENAGAPFAYQMIYKHIEGKYFVHLPNDVMVTKNWLNNLIKCAESDKKIGMVTPVSSNVSNYQMVELPFSNEDEMQQAASEYNLSDPVKWQERLRIVTLGSLFTRECLMAIGPILDCGFMHDFGDDDVSFRVRRAGYKTILARDTWIHHNHDIFDGKSRNPTDVQKSLDIGRKNFQDKYYGIDAWDDVNNFIFPYVEEHIDMPSDCENVKILGIDVRCGTPILDIKNIIRQYGIYDPETSAFTQHSKYDIDLRTICSGNVICGGISHICNYFDSNQFDYIVIGNDINTYADPEKVINDIYLLLKSGGQLFISLKNTRNVFVLLNMLGYDVNFADSCVNMTIDSLLEEMNRKNINIDLISNEPFQMDHTVSNYVNDLINMSSPQGTSKNMIRNKLMTDRYRFKIVKRI